MPADNAILADLDPWERIDRMPDGRPLKSSEAAVFTTFSLSTLERMRVKGTGPDYFQGGIRVSGKVPATGGTNQHIRYFKEDIKAWFKAGMVSSSMQAAIKKGQAFATIFDLAEAEPYYLDANGYVAGRVEFTPLDVVIERLGEWDILWMPAFEAAARPWSSLADHQAFGKNVEGVLSHASRAIAAGLEATDIGIETRIPPKTPPEPDH